MKFAAFLAIATVVFLPLSTSAYSQNAPERVKIRFAQSGAGAGGRPFVGGNISALAHNEGLIQKEFANDPNVDIVWSLHTGTATEVNEGLAGGLIDIAHMGDLGAVIGAANRLKIKIVMVNQSRAPIYIGVQPGSSIEKIEDLKGKKVAFTRGSNVQSILGKVLSDHGLKESDLNVLNMKAGDYTAALAARDIDAAIGLTEILDLKERGFATLMYSTKFDKPLYGRQAVIVVADDFAKKHPIIVGRVVKALVKAASWASDETNREALFDSWAKSGVDRRGYAADYAEQKMAIRMKPTIDPMFRAQMEQLANMSLQLGFIRRPVDVNNLLNPQYLDAAIAELNLKDLWPAQDADGNVISK